MQTFVAPRLADLLELTEGEVGEMHSCVIGTGHCCLAVVLFCLLAIARDGNSLDEVKLPLQAVGTS